MHNQIPQQETNGVEILVQNSVESQNLCKITGAEGDLVDVVEGVVGEVLVNPIFVAQVNPSIGGSSLELCTWKIFRAALTTDVTVRSVGVAMPNMCDLSGMEEESISHVFVSYSIAHAQWCRLSAIIGSGILEGESPIYRFFGSFAVKSGESVDFSGNGIFLVAGRLLLQQDQSKRPFVRLVRRVLCEQRYGIG
ncbi:unnamed protein product [Ilex paraguariensis]|uniref:Uncharacterized protein n=1 Tax=Ilex paraguariensis TaxID=185542 RepID=A0ABC8SZZ8_9AQUA